ncbi:hypothetical protein NE236_05550 [Actinoallomurus purpureus]|uniref:hypothetical protein n=1 Tax=Actinoallomurus purpureus TaxID=478114 RepID=UPI002093590E|nr:hypothetical protein [Actinoallomurus purpureus]MCO6004442.1 hypothetical protein [Actinoallomurus purpureus]
MPHDDVHTRPEDRATMAKEEVHRLMYRLADACRQRGLDALQLAPTRVRVSPPDAAHPEMTEIITLKADEEGRLFFHWSWDEKICPADELEWAAHVIKNVVAPEAMP